MTTVSKTIALSGAPGSPYTRKMVGILRYRRIAYRLLYLSDEAMAGLPRPKVQLLPTFYLRDETDELQALTDSTPIIRRLERDYTGRSVLPNDAALAFIDALIEDYADEWLTKAMFHYRWSYAADIAKASLLLPCWRGFSIPDQELRELGESVSRRQIARLRYVGSNASTGPVIEASYRRFLEAFEAHLTLHPYLLGSRPASCDFAVFGQLTQLAEFDPTPMALTLEIAPRVVAWVGMMEDQSGTEPTDEGWISLATPPVTLLALLGEVGRVYPPIMLANSEAVTTGAAEVSAVIDGQIWTQQPFPYQAKCLFALRQHYAGLPAEARETVAAIFEPAGLTPIIS